MRRRTLIQIAGGMAVWLWCVLPASGIEPEPRLQFQVNTEASGALEIGKFYKGSVDLAGFPIRPLWTQEHPKFWIEQDGAMRHRRHEVIQSDAVVEGVRGLLLRLKEARKPGEAAEETFVPFSEGPVEGAKLKRRLQIPGAAEAQWKDLGPPSWCGTHAPVRRPPSSATQDPTQLREWRSRDGSRRFKAALVGGTPNRLELRLESNRSVTAQLEHFCQDDQILLMKWLETHPWQVRYPAQISVPMSEGKGMTRVARPVDTAPADDSRHLFTYTTKHFDFASTVPLGEQHLHAVGVSFEATRRLIAALPWGIPLPAEASGRNQVKLFETQEEYAAAGGPPYTAGNYRPQSRCFFAPLESLGLIQQGRDVYRLDKGKVVYDVLHHELTHQQMHELLDFLPMWIIEGTAEFIGNLPYAEGGFRLEAGPDQLRRFFAPSRALKKLAERRGPVASPKEAPLEFFPFEMLLRQPYWPKTGSLPTTNPFIGSPGGGEDPRVTRQRYNSSFLLVYYFVHLDPDRSRLPRFLLSGHRLALEVNSVPRWAREYQREWTDPHNRDVLENYARVEAYNRLVTEFNASLRSGGSVEQPRTPFWAELGPPPPPFTLTGQVASFFQPGESFGPPALDWIPPAREGKLPNSSDPSGEKPKPNKSPGVPPVPGRFEVEVRRFPSERDSDSSALDRLNKLPSTAVMLKNQEAVLGTPAEIAGRARAAFAQHQFPLP